MKSLLSVLFGLFVAASAALANEEAPDAMIRKVTDDVLNIVRQDKDIRSGNTRKAIELVEAKVLHNFNFQRMTALAMGRDWNKANAEQKKRLTDEFKTLLVRTYAGALAQVSDQTVAMKPLRAAPEDKELVVRTEIIGQGDPIQLDYRLEKTPGQGAGWKIYNLNVMGVWLVETYRSQFAQEISAKGLDGLIAALQARNQRNALAKN